MTLADRIAVMRDGHLVQFGTQSEIYQRPRDTYVATFVGKPRMSLLEGDLRAEGDALRLEEESLAIPLGSVAALRIDGETPRRVLVGVRAEDVRVHLDAEAPSPASFAAVVALLEPVGSDTFVELSVGPATVIARVAPDLPLRIGQPVHAELAPNRIHLFHPDSGQRVAA